MIIISKQYNCKYSKNITIKFNFHIFMHFMHNHEYGYPIQIGTYFLVFNHYFSSKLFLFLMQIIYKLIFKGIPIITCLIDFSMENKNINFTK